MCPVTRFFQALDRLPAVPLMWVGGILGCIEAGIALSIAIGRAHGLVTP